MAIRPDKSLFGRAHVYCRWMIHNARHVFSQSSIFFQPTLIHIAEHCRDSLISQYTMISMDDASSNVVVVATGVDDQRAIQYNSSSTDPTLLSIELCDWLSSVRDAVSYLSICSFWLKFADCVLLIVDHFMCRHRRPGLSRCSF